jgi:hypothetical protein
VEADAVLERDGAGEVVVVPMSMAVPVIVGVAVVVMMIVVVLMIVHDNSLQYTCFWGT